jgi:hypothetical protein
MSLRAAFKRAFSIGAALTPDCPQLADFEFLFEL